MTTSKNGSTPRPVYGFYRPHPRVIAESGQGEPSMTKQEFKADCDINRILNKYQRTGALTHFSKFSPSYGDFSPLDYQSAQNLLIRAKEMFAQLPSSIRAETKTPEGFLAFVQDPKNKGRMSELGLLNPTKAAEPPTPTPEPGTEPNSAPTPTPSP